MAQLVAHTYFIARVQSSFRRPDSMFLSLFLCPLFLAGEWWGTREATGKHKGQWVHEFVDKAMLSPFVVITDDDDHSMF